LADKSQKKLDRKVESATVERVFAHIEKRFGRTQFKLEQSVPPATPRPRSPSPQPAVEFMTPSRKMEVMPSRPVPSRLHQEVFGKRKPHSEKHAKVRPDPVRSDPASHLASMTPRERRQNA
jgi:hypothetical protein